MRVLSLLIFFFAASAESLLPDTNLTKASRENEPSVPEMSSDAIKPQIPASEKLGDQMSKTRVFSTSTETEGTVDSHAEGTRDVERETPGENEHEEDEKRHDEKMNFLEFIVTGQKGHVLKKQILDHSKSVDERPSENPPTVSQTYHEPSGHQSAVPTFTPLRVAFTKQTVLTPKIETTVHPSSSKTSNNEFASLIPTGTSHSKFHPKKGNKKATTVAMATAARNKSTSFRPEPQLGVSKIKVKKNVGNVTKSKPPTNPKVKVRGTKVVSNKKPVEKLREEKEESTSAPYFPYFTDEYCPPECACYGRVVQCSDKHLDNIPYGIPYNSRYILLMNNRINALPLDLLSEYVSMEFLALSNNLLNDSSVEGAFEAIPALKKLHLERNLFHNVPLDLPASLEELRLDGNRVNALSESAWRRCPGMVLLSLSNNSLGDVSPSTTMPPGVLSPLTSLRTLSLAHNRLTSVPLDLPLSIQELYLRGNRIQHFPGGVFLGKAELRVLDLSINRLTDKGLGEASLVHVSRLESLNLEGNFLKQVPRHLPRSLKTLNLEGNAIASVGKAAFRALPNLEHLGLRRNKIGRVASGAFRMLPLLHQLDLSHNALREVPRRLPPWLVSVTISNNKIGAVARDAFCWSDGGGEVAKPSRLVKVQLENNLLDLGRLDSRVFDCLRGYQVLHFY